MDAIEAEYHVLAGALPRGYTAFEADLLADLVKIFDRPANSHVFSEEQLANLNAIVWLCRGKGDKFAALVQRHQQQAAHWLTLLPERLQADDAAVERLTVLLCAFSEKATLDELNKDQPAENHIAPTLLDAFRADLAAAAPAIPPFRPSLS